MRNKPGGVEKSNTKSLKDSEIRYRRLFEAAQDGILILDAETGAITDVNPFLINLLGYSREEFLSKKLWEVGAFKDIKASKQAFKALQENEYVRYKDLPLRTKDGELIQVEFVSNVYPEGDKNVIQCNIRDITERKQAQDALVKSEAFLREQSVRDHLTGLFNRRYMEETLERELIRASRQHLPVGLMMLDVDDFKRFNDNFGHAAGDAILRELGNLLIEHVREEDVACRYGGDEFIIVLFGASRELARKRAERLCSLVRLASLQFEGKSLESVTVSVGVAIFPEDGDTRKAILKAVDAALYRAKNSGRGQVAMAD